VRDKQELYYARCQQRRSEWQQWSVICPR